MPPRCRSAEVRTSVRALDAADLPAARHLLARDPLTHLFLLSRLEATGLDRSRLGCPVLGAFRGGDLVGMVHLGANLVPVANDEDALDALARRSGWWRRCSSIMGAAPTVIGFYSRMLRRGGDSWHHPRDIRDDQPLLVLDTAPALAPDPRVVVVGESDFESYFEAAVAMYTEEVGVSPLDPSQSYRTHMVSLVRRGRCLAILEDRRVRWKSDVALSWQGHCQVQGVWMDPAWRGRGLAAAAMAGVVVRARAHHPVVSLYANSFNTAALHTYRRVGFRQVGRMATVLY